MGKKFIYILYVVGFYWNDYEKKEDCINLLVDIVINVLKMVDFLFIVFVVMFVISFGKVCDIYFYLFDEIKRSYKDRLL